LIRRYTAYTDYDGFPSKESAREFARNTPDAKKEGMEMHWARPSITEIYRNEKGEVIK
jgi:hypothetical protein